MLRQGQTVKYVLLNLLFIVASLLLVVRPGAPGSFLFLSKKEQQKGPKVSFAEKTKTKTKKAKRRKKGRALLTLDKRKETFVDLDFFSGPDRIFCQKRNAFWKA